MRACPAEPGKPRLPASTRALKLLIACLACPFVFQSCVDETSGPQGNPGYATRTDGRGWAVSDEGLFGHRRVEATQRPAMTGIGYAQGSEAAPLQTGVRVRIPDRMAPGLNLMNSGDAAEAVLMTSTGAIEHRWALPYDEIPGAAPLETAFQIPWRRVHLRDDGSLLAIHSDAALVHIDVDSKLRWIAPGRFHHALDVAEGPDGPTIYLLSRAERLVPAVNPEEAVIDDLVVGLDATGQEVLRVSLWDAFLASEWAPMLERLNQRTGDVMHANSLVILDAADAERFRTADVQAGAALVCMRDLDLVTVIDLERGKLVWMTAGPAASPWRGLHDPTLTESGELLVFDNLGGPAGHSRLLRVPLSPLVGSPPYSPRASWTWLGTPPEAFSSQFCGIAEELPGGNVLATESCHGRVLEIDPGTGEIVWEFVSERVAGEDDELVAALFEVRRIARPDWLDR